MAGSLHHTCSRCTFKYSLFMIACQYATCRLNHQLKRSHNNIPETDHINNKTSKGSTNVITSHYIYSPIWKTIAQLTCLRSHSSTELPTTPPPYRPRSNKTATTFTLLLCIILSGDIQLNPGPISEDAEILTTNHVDPTRHNSLIDRTNTNDTSQTYDLTFGPNPKNTSTPERSRKTKRNTLNAILINTNSIKSITKTTQLKTTFQSNNPDIIFLVETQIDKNYPTYSFLPPNYNAIRKDRSIHGGGVLIAFRDDIVAEPLTNLYSNCDIVWKKVQFTRNKSIYFAPTTDPPMTISNRLKHESLTKLYRTQKNPPNVVIAGDFNLPDINWSKQQITNNRTASKHNKRLEIINECGLQNMKNNPTRID
ncbi:hypothetical protein NP493_1014g01000 [Ridgeia piscesae]|uniref:Endonuclease/exonuclease/phosphatase domain-containing protein n=1 Tax=Ridgeia piscesae TaxID=27915 RepID=A0AAD9KHX2_RIDPI|nr:hypothetical protein NP493_1014g01000 [Ridgeia piscesae]